MTDVRRQRLSRRGVLAAAGAVAAAATLPTLEGLRPRAAHAAPTGFYVGANVSGLETNGGKIPGIPRTDYAVPTHEEFDYLRRNGLMVIRLPFIWERIQPTLNGSLDPTYLGFLTDLATYAGANGQSVILDMHNYGGRGPNKLGNGNLTSAHFANVWSRIATAFNGHPGVAAYDLMNEPSNMPNSGAWPAAAQAAINAIRAVDATTTIYAEGDNWSSAASWVAVNGNLNLNDPAGNLVYSAHTYFDRDSSGSHFIWADEVAAGDQLKNPPGPLTTQIGVQRLTGFVNWLAEKGFRGQIGECGVGNNDPQWLVTLDNTLAFCQSHDVGVTYWSAGLWFQTYPMGIEPPADGRDTVQMAVLQKYTGASPSTRFYASGPDRGSPGSASGAFLVDYRGYHTGSLSITPTTSGGGTFTPSALTIPAGFNGTATFTYTAPAAATYALNCTNTSGLTDPAPLGYSTRADGYSLVNSTSILNVLATRRLYTPFIGDAVLLQRASDGVRQSFVFGSSDNLDGAAISSWAGGSDVLVVQLNDQSPRRRNAGPVVTQNKNGSGSTHLPSRTADYPKLILNGLNGMPILRFYKSRMDAVSPINGLTGFTAFLVCKPTTAASMQRLLSWHFTEYLLLSGDSTSSWQQSGESSLSMGTAPTAWHIYAVRWSGGGQRTTWVDGNVIASAAAATSNITFLNENHVNIGYFRWYPDVHFQGDVWALLPFSVALTDAQMDSMWNALSAATGIPV